MPDPNHAADPVRLRLALAVCRAAVGDTAENIRRMRDFCALAAKDHAGLILFPELSLTGYQLDPETANAMAEGSSGPLAEEVKAAARDFGLFVFAGFVEKKNEGRPFIAHAAAGPDGSFALFRKLHLSPAEAPVYCPGDEIGLTSVNGFSLGLAICYDTHFPELFTRLALAGADAVLCPFASPRGTGQQKVESLLRHLPARAFDNGVFVAATNQTGENESGLCFPGGALAISPLGRVAAADGSGREGLLFADLCRDELSQVRGHRMRYFLPGRRKDLWDLPVRVPSS
ncbi:MAG: nitrilase-related carbon-nitrogen hydrolase [Thermodesulfobacteriota bacterium]